MSKHEYTDDGFRVTRNMRMAIAAAQVCESMKIALHADMIAKIIRGRPLELWSYSDNPPSDAQLKRGLAEFMRADGGDSWGRGCVHGHVVALGNAVYEWRRS